MADDEAHERAVRAIRRIADALGVPVATLFENREIGAPVDGTTATLDEVRALLDAFLALRDPEARRRCIATVEAATAEEIAREYGRRLAAQ